MGLLVVVADDVRMIVGLLQDGDFARGECDEVLEKALHSDSAALERSLENDCSM